MFESLGTFVGAVGTIYGSSDDTKVAVCHIQHKESVYLKPAFPIHGRSAVEGTVVSVHVVASLALSVAMSSPSLKVRFAGWRHNAFCFRQTSLCARRYMSLELAGPPLEHLWRIVSGLGGLALLTSEVCGQIHMAEVPYVDESWESVLVAARTGT